MWLARWGRWWRGRRLRARVLLHMRRGGAWTGPELARALKEPEAEVVIALRQLHRRGRIQVTDRGFVAANR